MIKILRMEDAGRSGGEALIKAATSTAAFGAPEILARAGGDEEYLQRSQELREAHPWKSFFGDVLGTLPALALGGGIFAKAGQKAVEGIAREGLKKVVATGVTGAVAGGVTMVPEGVRQVAQTEGDITPEGALETIAMNVGIGAAMGAILDPVLLGISTKASKHLAKLTKVREAQEGLPLAKGDLSEVASKIKDSDKVFKAAEKRINDLRKENGGLEILMSKEKDPRKLEELAEQAAKIKEEIDGWQKYQADYIQTEENIKSIRQKIIERDAANTQAKAQAKKQPPPPTTVEGAVKAAENAQAEAGLGVTPEAQASGVVPEAPSVRFTEDPLPVTEDLVGPKPGEVKINTPAENYAEAIDAVHGSGKATRKIDLSKPDAESVLEQLADNRLKGVKPEELPEKIGPYINSKKVELLDVQHKIEFYKTGKVPEGLGAKWKGNKKFTGEVDPALYNAEDKLLKKIKIAEDFRDQVKLSSLRGEAGQAAKAPVEAGPDIGNITRKMSAAELGEAAGIKAGPVREFHLPEISASADKLASAEALRSVKKAQSVDEIVNAFRDKVLTNKGMRPETSEHLNRFLMEQLQKPQSEKSYFKFLNNQDAIEVIGQIKKLENEFVSGADEAFAAQAAKEASSSSAGPSAGGIGFDKTVIDPLGAAQIPLEKQLTILVKKLAKMKNPVEIQEAILKGQTKRLANDVELSALKKKRADEIASFAEQLAENKKELQKLEVDHVGNAKRLAELRADRATLEAKVSAYRQLAGEAQARSWGGIVSAAGGIIVGSMMESMLMGVMGGGVIGWVVGKFAGNFFRSGGPKQKLVSLAMARNAERLAKAISTKPIKTAMILSISKTVAEQESAEVYEDYLNAYTDAGLPQDQAKVGAAIQAARVDLIKSALKNPSAAARDNMLRAVMYPNATVYRVANSMGTPEDFAVMETLFAGTYASVKLAAAQVLETLEEDDPDRKRLMGIINPQAAKNTANALGQARQFNAQPGPAPKQVSMGQSKRLETNFGRISKGA
jgi:hypothetical protein